MRTVSISVGATRVLDGARGLLPILEVRLEGFPSIVGLSGVSRRRVETCQQKILACPWHRGLEVRSQGPGGVWTKCNGGESPLQGQKLGRDFPYFPDGVQRRCGLAFRKLRFRQTEPRRLILAVKPQLQPEFSLRFFQLARVQVGLPYGGVETGLFGFTRERQQVFFRCIVPTVTLGQHIAEKAIAPRRATIHLRSSKRQTGG